MSSTQYCFVRGPKGSLVPVQPQDDPDCLLGHYFSRNASRILDNLMEDQHLSNACIGKQCFTTEQCISHYRHNKRPVPLALAAMVDHLVRQPVFLQALAEMEGYGIYKLQNKETA